jgi:hypothetical protein
VKPLVITLAACGLLLAVPAFAQQRETGPAASPNAEHPIRNPETGVRGPSGASPDTGPHGQRDLTKNAEPGKEQSPEERRQTGQVPQGQSPKQN